MLSFRIVYFISKVKTFCITIWCKHSNCSSSQSWSLRVAVAVGTALYLTRQQDPGFPFSKSATKSKTCSLFIWNDKYKRQTLSVVREPAKTQLLLWLVDNWAYQFPPYELRKGFVNYFPELIFILLHYYMHICYLPARRSVLGKTVPEVSSTARGRRPRAVLKSGGTVFPNTDRSRPANNVFIIFFRRVLCKQFLCWIFTAAIFKPGVRVRLTVRKTHNIIVCFLGHYLHSTFFAAKKKLLEKTQKLEN